MLPAAMERIRRRLAGADDGNTSGAPDAAVSALGWRPEGDPKLEVIIRTRSGASIYSWTFGFSVRCADTNRPLPPFSQVVPEDIAANLFNSVGTVEISEYREPKSPILTARQCPS